jgi:hypothetical protein
MHAGSWYYCTWLAQEEHAHVVTAEDVCDHRSVAAHVPANTHGESYNHIRPISNCRYAMKLRLEAGAVITAKSADVSHDGLQFVHAHPALFASEEQPIACVPSQNKRAKMRY